MNTSIIKSPDTGDRQENFVRGDIDALPPELKCIADGYIKKWHSPETALKEALLQEDINALPERLRDIANVCLLQGYTRAGVLREIEIIEALPPKKKTLADEYLGKGYSPARALREVRARENIEALPAQSKAFAKKCLKEGMSPSEAMESAQQESQRLTDIEAQRIGNSVQGRK